MKSSRESNRLGRNDLVGSIVRIPLADGSFGFGQILDEPLVAFFDLRAFTDVPLADIAGANVLFSVWVMNDAIECNWQCIGHSEISPSINRKPAFFKKDAISGEYSITFDGGDEIPAARSDVEGLERAAVWSANHIEDRLLDYFEGRPNAWVESLFP